MDAVGLIVVCAGIWGTAHAINKWLQAGNRKLRIDPQWDVDFSHYQYFDHRSIPYLARMRAGLDPVTGRVPEPGTVQLTAPTFDSGLIHFESGEPEWLRDYYGQPQVTEFLQASIEGMTAHRYRLRPQLFVGPAGLGKTALAKVLANEIRQRLRVNVIPEPLFVETIGSGIPNGAALDELVRQASDREGSVLFIDEIHSLKWGEFGERLYPLLQDQRYRYLEDPGFTELPDFTVIGATTEPGALSDPILRRFDVHQLRPLDAAAIKDIVVQRPFPIEDDAAWAIVSRTHFIGAPWDALNVRNRAEVYARGRHADCIEIADVAKVFVLEGVDENGLREEHRRVIQTLLAQPLKGPRAGRDEVAPQFHCMSESNLIATTRMDPKQFRKRIRPWLMASGMLYVQGYFGHTLTRKAETAYGGRHV